MSACLGILLVTSSDGRWHPGIGDPTIIGWVTVVAYLVAGVLCVRAAKAARTAGRALGHTKSTLAREERSLFLLWTCSAIAMFALGINKQLDLQSWFTQIARDMAVAGGWYENRRIYQFGFIVFIAVVGGLGTATLAFMLRHVRARARGTILGLGVVMSFVVIRAASFHHFDILIGARILGVKVNWILELGGIAIIAMATHRAAQNYRASSQLR